MAVERAELIADVSQIEEPVDLAQQVIAGNVARQIKIVEQLRRAGLLAGHRQILPTTQNQVNQGTCRAATETFSTKQA